MRYDETERCDGTLEEVLKDCSKWLKARRKRHAKPAGVWVNFSHGHYLRANVTESPDDIIAALFDASLYNKRIIRIQHYYAGIYVIVREASFPVKPEYYTEKTNIDLPVMETILSWFKEENK